MAGFTCAWSTSSGEIITKPKIVLKVFTCPLCPELSKAKQSKKCRWIALSTVYEAYKCYSFLTSQLTSSFTLFQFNLWANAHHWPINNLFLAVWLWIQTTQRRAFTQNLTRVQSVVCAERPAVCTSLRVSHLSSLRQEAAGKQRPIKCSSRPCNSKEMYARGQTKHRWAHSHLQSWVFIISLHALWQTQATLRGCIRDLQLHLPQVLMNMRYTLLINWMLIIPHITMIAAKCYLSSHK